MRSGVPNNLILNGFDRCGSSAISRVLTDHPQIELIMQPFNGGSIRRKLYKILDNNNTTAADFGFFENLQKDKLDTSYIESEWHKKYSTVSHFSHGKLHVLKTTQNHFTASWIKTNFPRLEQWGIWRDPIDILASLVRNDFHIQWYAGAIDELIPTVRSNKLLNDQFGWAIHRATDDLRKMAVVFAVRSYFYFYHIDIDKVLFYEHFLESRNSCLRKITDYFGLIQFNFEESDDRRDLNITGKFYKPGAKYSEEIPMDQRKFLSKLFEPLRELMNQDL